MAAIDYFHKVGRSTATTLSSPGYTIGNTSINVASTTNYPTDTGVTVSIDEIDGAGERIEGTLNVFRGDVASATQINELVYVGGDANRNYSASATTRVYITVSSFQVNRMVDGILEEHKQTGAHSDITADSIVVTGNVQAGSFSITGAGGDNGWEVGLPAPDTVTYNGNRSYDLVFNSTDLTDTVSEGMRLRTTRTVTAPTQCTDLESSSSQYFSATSASLAGMTFIDDLTAMGWVKLESYPTIAGGVISRFGGASGWALRVMDTGQVSFFAGTGGALDDVKSYQSLPIGKWVHIAASLDLSSSTGLIYIDGVLVPSAYTNTASTSLTQSGDLNVGTYNNGTTYFDGKIAQVAVFSSVLSAATIRSYMSQGLTGSETNLVSAYSCNNSLLDLNTTNNNDLTANGGALMTNADSPFGNYLGGTLDYAIITKTAFSTNTTLTVQVPEGCTIPTSGGVSAVAYSTQSVPYGFPRDGGRWRISSLLRTNSITTSNATFGTFISGGYTLAVPSGAWRVGHRGIFRAETTTNLTFVVSPTSLIGLSYQPAIDISPLSVLCVSAAAATIYQRAEVSDNYVLSALTSYTMYTFGASTAGGIYASFGLSEIFAEFNYL